MTNGLTTWMIRSASGQSTSTSPLVAAGREHGPAVIIPVYAVAAVFSVVLLAVSTPLSVGAYIMIRLIVVAVWVAVGLLLVFIGTNLAHSMAAWGVGLTGAIISLFAALSDFSTSAALATYGQSQVGLGFFDLIIAVGFGWATTIMLRTMSRLSAPAPEGVAAAPGPSQPFRDTPKPETPLAQHPGLTKPTPAPAATPQRPTTTDPIGYPTPTQQPPTSASTGSPGAYGNAPISPGFYASPYLPPTGMQPPQNAMATLALILGILVPPAGIIVGHISLSQIKRTQEGGRQLATAGLIIGYILTGIAIASWIAIVAFTASVTNSIDSSLNQLTTPTTTTETTAAETTPPNYTPDPSNPIGNVIRTTGVGTCLHKEASGSTITALYTVACSSPEANYKVTDRVSTTDECGLNWVQSSSGVNDSMEIVLCLTIN